MCFKRAAKKIISFIAEKKHVPVCVYICIRVYQVYMCVPPTSEFCTFYIFFFFLLAKLPTLHNDLGC